jgi:hypothetical protein
MVMAKNPVDQVVKLIREAKDMGISDQDIANAVVKGYTRNRTIKKDKS